MNKRITYLIILLFLFSNTQAQICSKAQLPANLQNGLVAYYPFCGNANDASGNAYNGTITGGGVPFVNDRFGNASSAAQLGGGYIVTSASAFTFQQNQAFTVSLWFTLETNGGGGRILSTECPEGNFRIGTGVNGNYAVQYGDYINDIVSLNTWTHLVYTYDNRSEKVYINGVLKHSNTEATNLSFTHCPLTIGAKASSAFDRWTGKADDLMVYNRALNACEVSQMYNAANGSIPQLQTPAINTLSDTTKVCGTSATLDAGSGYSSYSWNTGETTQSISASTSGWYKVTVTNAAGCSASDSTYLSIVKANIIQSDTTICKGASIKLSIDSVFSSSTSCNPVSMPSGLRNGLVAYYPFCGNANDATGNGNNGIIYGAIPASDRFGNANSAYSFDGATQYIQSASLSKSIASKTYSAWVKLSTVSQGGGGLAGLQSSTGGIFDVVVYNETNTGWGFGSDYLSRSYWSGVKETASEWAMITATYEQNSYKIYRNGILIGSTTQFGITNFGTTSKINIGYRHTGGASRYLNAIIDDVYIYDRVLTPQEISLLYKSTSASWSTGATTNSITVTPTQTTKYYVTVSDGITSCQDSITVSVIDPSVYNPLQDTLRVCGDSVTLDAGSGYASYNWSNGANTQKITAKSGGKYVVNVGNGAGCNASDSSLVSIVKAKILQKDTTICMGSSINLSVNSNNSCEFTTLSKFPGTKRIASISLTAGNKGYFGTGFSTSLNDFWEFNFQTNTWTQLANYPGGTIHDPISFVYKDEPYVGLGEDGSPKGIWKYSPSINQWSKLTDFPGPGRYNSSSFVIGDTLYIVGGFSKSSNACLSDFWKYNLKTNTWSKLSDFPGGTNRSSHTQVLNGKAYMVIGGNDNCSITGINQFWEYDPSRNTWIRKKDYPAKNPHAYSKVSYAENGKVVFGMGYNEPNFYSYDIPTNSWDSLTCTYPGTRDPIFFRYDNSVYLGMGFDYITTNNYVDAFIKLNPRSINEITWSTGAKTDSIKITPTQTTKYYVTVSDGITSCKDSITVTINDFAGFNPLQDTTRVCGDSVILDAGSGYATYNWSNGATTQKITAKSGGRYLVNIGNGAGCNASDSSFVSIVKAKILQRDTILCRNTTIKLSIDTAFPKTSISNFSPINISSGLRAYYPFNGNANDESGFGNNATVYNAILTSDQTGAPNKAYSFSPSRQSSIIANRLDTTMRNSFAYSFWVRPTATCTIPPEGQSANAASGLFNNPCVVHPIHGSNYGPATSNAGTGIYVGTNGLYLEEHSDGWEAVPINYTGDLTGWHLINLMYTNKVPSLYIDGKFIKSGVASVRNIYASLGPDKWPGYTKSGIGAGYQPGSTTTQYFSGDIDELRYYNRALSGQEIQNIYNGNAKILWSTGDTTPTINVSPTQTTKYYVTVSDGITSCKDSITITVDQLAGFNPLQDTTRVCGDSLILDAGSGYTSYSWSNGATTQKTTAKDGGKYKVDISNSTGCTASDSTYMSIIKTKIIQNDTTVCRATTIKLSLANACVDSSNAGWQLLIPGSSYIGSQTNFNSSGFDPVSRTWYSVLRGGTSNKTYAFNLTNNTVSTITQAGGPAEIYQYTYDRTNNRLLAGRVGRDALYSLPVTGGTWQSYGTGGFDAESYGSISYWNPVTKKFGFFGGYGFFATKNWVWENGGGSWSNPYTNNNNCNLAKRSTNKIALNSTGNKMYIFSGQGSCNGDQFAKSCSLGSPWPTDVGVYCWLRDLWELDLSTFQFTSILPANNQSITRDGAFAFDHDNNTFYNIGGRAPTPTFGVYTPFTMNVGKFQRGVDAGFTDIPISGTPPPADKDGVAVYDQQGKRIIYARIDGIWAINLAGNSSCNLKYKWSTGDTTATINVTPTQTTKYYVTVSDGITSCQDSVTVTVAQLDTSIVALDPTSVCSTGGTVRLQAGVASAYQWLKDGAAISGANAQLLSATQTGSYRVVVTNATGCSDTSRAINIVLDPKPVPNFTINSNAQCLTENGFIFTNTSTIASGTMTYAWSLGNGTTASSSDASISYTTAGTYNIKLVATSNRLCTDSITKSVTVYPQPAIPTITGADAFCTGASIVLNTDAPTPRQWYRNNVLVTNGSGSTLTIQQPGDYKVSTVNANGCTTFSAVKTITENPLPQGSLVTPTSAFICEGTPYTLTANGGASYQWFLNNVAIAGQTSATLNTSIAGNYKVEFVSDKGCRAMSTNSIDLSLIKAPDADFSFDTYCVNVQTNFSSRSTTNQSGNVTYAWRFGDGRTAGSTINASNTYTRTGSFTATLRVTPNACPQLADSAQAVLVIQAPTPGIQYPPVNAIINKAQQLNARNIGNSYQWNPAIFLSNSTSRTPSVTPTKEQLYRIIITNIAGCTTVDTQLVRVFADRNIYVPEGFTPDNDGRNDRLYPISVGISEMKVFRIYNRWGLLVYDNKNANANTGWDGNYKGTKQPMETYAWVAEGIDIDGNFIRRTGNSILVR